MMDPKPKSDRPSWKRWLLAGGGILLFVAFGLAVIPGLARYQRSEEIPALENQSPQPTRNTQTLAMASKSETTGMDGSAAKRPPAPFPNLASDDYDCMIAPNKVIEIGSSITGLIETVHVERSEYVKADQVVVQLESSVEEATVRLANVRADRKVDVEASETNLSLQEKRRKRARNLFEQDSLSADGRDQVETEAKLARLDLQRSREDRRVLSLQLDQARAALERHTIRSPLAGFVVDVLMHEGEVVDEETILRIAEIDPLRVEVILPASMFGKIKEGDQAEVFAETGLDDTLKAEVVIVDRIIDGPSGTFGARLTLPNPEHDLPAGLRCQVRFLEAEEDAMAQRPSTTPSATTVPTPSTLAAGQKSGSGSPSTP